jgi:hypothetical protein
LAVVAPVDLDVLARVGVPLADDSRRRLLVALLEGTGVGETSENKFVKGAKLVDSKKVFNSSLDGNVRQAIDWFEGDTVNAIAFKALGRAALNPSAER